MLRFVQFYHAPPRTFFYTSTFFGTTNLLFLIKNVMTAATEDKIMLVMVVVIFLSWLLRNTPLFFLWRIIRAIFIIILSILLLNYIENGIKSIFRR